MKRYLLLWILIAFIPLGLILLVVYSVSKQPYGSVQLVQNHLLPDSKLTPGAINPSITQENISQNICNKAWSTKSIRPNTSYTNKLKAQQIKEYGYSDTNMTHYELDHLISLTDGGNPTDPKNLWPEAYEPRPGAHEKDRYEMYVHKQICSGVITLAEGQKRLATNWYYWYLQAGLDKTSSTILNED